VKERERVPKGQFEGIVTVNKEDLPLYHRLWSRHGIHFSVREGLLPPPPSRVYSQGSSQWSEVPEGMVALSVYYDGNNRRKFNEDWNHLKGRVEEYKKAGLVKRLMMHVV